MSQVITISNLKKNYGNHEVLKGVDLSIEKGEIFGILGINGAGKTTLLECIEGFRHYHSGNIKIAGNIGIQLQSASLPSYMRVDEAIQLFSKWKNKNLDPSLFTALNITEINKKLYYQLSAGQKRKLHLALALIGEPDILILDEPTTELDVEAKQALHQEIKKLSQKGTTILLSSHDMAEVESLCTRIAILNQGKIIFVGTTEQLAKKVNKKYSIKIIDENEEKEYFTSDIIDTLSTILEQYKLKNKPILDIKINRGTLEDHFIELSKEVRS
ncbi:putative uncharacterized protein [Firmicutes bacterium CAG:308]|nr:putative uncharacterized protein [Firmicutes bacterium CAG:308]